MVTRKEVAALAGVSEATVSRVFSGAGPLKEETRKRVLEAAKQLDYHPNAIARSFARRRSGNLGVVLPYVPKVHLFSTYYFSEILNGIGEAVRDKGYDLLVRFRSPADTADYASWYRSQKVDACVLLGASDAPGERHALRELERLGLPFCVVNQHYAGERFSEIDADHVEGSYAAVTHLIAGGHLRIAFLNGPLQYSNSLDRLAGYRRALQEAGLPYDESLVLAGNYSRKSGYEAAAAVAARLDRIDAVFAANDRMAIGLMQGLRERGIEPEGRLGIVGYDDSDAARLIDPPLTSVQVPFSDMGRLAASRLLDAALGTTPAEPFAEKLPTRLVVRRSSARRA